ncbi:hypothetical protein CFOL_v3_26390, partial [Cephalotus follicularis]
CECQSFKAYLEHDQQQKLLQFLMGLNESYGSIRSQILMMSPLPSVGQAFSLISHKESHRGIIARTNSHGNVPVVFYSNKVKYATVICEHCNWSGHTKENCYRLIEYPPRHRLYKGQKGGDHNGLNQRIQRTVRSMWLTTTFQNPIVVSTLISMHPGCSLNWINIIKFRSCSTTMAQ